MNKKERIKLAQETLSIIEDDGYCPPGRGGAFYNLAVNAMIDRTIYYGPEAPPITTEFSITDQTTLEAAYEMSAGGYRIGVLNFASAKNPGGGFLRGTTAQEESLAYCSTLYASLNSSVAKPYYDHYRAARDPQYSDRMIYSPGVVIFRDDHGRLLPNPYNVDVLTSAAPNRREMEKRGSVSDELDEKLQLIINRRIVRVLRIFSDRGCDSLVLGAWGCGVFGNNPDVVAGLFYTHLVDGGYRGRFARVRFAVHGDQRNLEAFGGWFNIEPHCCTEVRQP